MGCIICNSTAVEVNSSHLTKHECKISAQFHLTCLLDQIDKSGNFQYPCCKKPLEIYPSNVFSMKKCHLLREYFNCLVRHGKSKDLVAMIQEHWFDEYAAWKCAIQLLADTKDKYVKAQWWVTIHALMISIVTRRDNTKLVQEILNLGVHVDANNNLLIRWAAKYGKSQIMQSLLNLGANLHAKTDEPLRSAARFGNLDIVNYLVEHGAHIHARHDEAFRMAARSAELETLKYLVEQGSDINALDGMALVQASFGNCYKCDLDELKCEHHIEVCKYLIDLGINIHCKNDEVLRKFAKQGKLDMVQYLVDKGANVHAQLDQAIVNAANNGHLEVFKYLVENGADIHAQDDAPLRMAILNGHLNIVKHLILKHGIDIHLQDGTPLRVAVLEDRLEIIKFLVERGVDIHYNNDLALQLAVQCGYYHVVQYLLEIGANIHALDHFAVVWGSAKHSNTMKHVIELGAKFEGGLTDELECTNYFRERGIPMATIDYQDVNTIRFLMERGIKIHGDFGEVFRSHRIEYENSTFLQLILKEGGIEVASWYDQERKKAARQTNLKLIKQIASRF